METEHKPGKRRVGFHNGRVGFHNGWSPLRVALQRDDENARNASLQPGNFFVAGS
jgi:hypothetical protein